MSVSPQDLSEICRACPIGKQLPDALYVHISAVNDLPEQLQSLIHQNLSTLNGYSFNIVKFNHKKSSISFLQYQNFECCPHPALEHSVQINFQSLARKELDYRDRKNPPILHRKETFISPKHPLHKIFSHLTQQEEELGLLRNTHKIGMQQQWQQRLKSMAIEVHDHALACHVSASTEYKHDHISTQPKPKIERHKAAIFRTTASKPLRLAFEAGLFKPATSFFDYGCGRGVDVQFVFEKGFESRGWDPHFFPDDSKCSADVVNIGYVINVIESLAERREALINAWKLTQKILIVSAQVMISDTENGWLAYGDGVITSRNTFQKYYEQEELKSYIDQVLGVDSIPVALGIFFVFRNETQAQTFRASKFRSRATTPRIRLSVKRFEEYQILLKPLMDFFTDRGRLPKPEELDGNAFGDLHKTFGSVKRAFRIVLQATDSSEWDAIADKRRNDLLVFIALTHFDHHRPKFSQLPLTVQNDIKGLFGSYQQACAAADLMLMSIGNLEMMRERSAQSSIGKKFKQSLWVHHTALDQLDPLLRLYEGCASRTIGRPEEATVIKFHFDKPQISYLSYDYFDQTPHPPLRTAMKIDLRDLQVRYYSFHLDDNAPLLSQKDKLVCLDYPQHEKFLKLTLQEKTWGLLDDPKQFTNQYQWQKCLFDHCAELKGHRLVWKKEADPAKLKFLKAQVRSKQRQLNTHSQALTDKGIC